MFTLTVLYAKHTNYVYQEIILPKLKCLRKQNIQICKNNHTYSILFNVFQNDKITFCLIFTSIWKDPMLHRSLHLGNPPSWCEIQWCSDALLVLHGLSKLTLLCLRLCMPVNKTKFIDFIVRKATSFI